MLTTSAQRARGLQYRVRSLDRLVREGTTRSEVRGQLAAGRWQRWGCAIVLHNASLTTDDTRAVALLNCGPGAVLTAFTSLEVRGLAGWTRPETHVLVPGGRHVRHLPAVAVRVHFSSDWSKESFTPGRRLHGRAESFVRATATLSNPRSACGLLAAGVQQRVVTSDELLRAVGAATRTRHRAVLLAALRDIGQGSHALSEIDFAQLCRRSGLPAPTRQSVRVEPSGRRRYLDVEWDLRDGRRLVVEIDGALHLVAARWWDDQLRQNELVIAGDQVLRFPSIVVRCEPAVVVDQLRRVLRV